MIRREFLKLLGALPFVSFFAKPRTVNFDPKKSYRNWVVITDMKDLDEAHKVVIENAKLLIPPEHHHRISVSDTFYPNNGNVGPIRVIGWYYNVDFKGHPNWRRTG